MNMEAQYLQLLSDTLKYGDVRGDRTGTGTRSLFGTPQLQCALSPNQPMVDDIVLPLLTTKKLAFRWIVEELLWMLRGETNVRPLQVKGVTIWDEWADTDGSLGPVYGKQWRAWTMPSGTFDQIHDLIKRIKEKPEDRRLIVSAWNVGEIHLMNLPPCHCFFQCYVRGGMFLDLKLYQRSADLFLGVPYNMASYALLTCMIAKMTDLTPGRFIHTFGDAHIYNNHIPQVEEQLKRMPGLPPRLVILDKPDRIEDFTFEHFLLEDYKAHPSIKAPVAV